MAGREILIPDFLKQTPLNQIHKRMGAQMVDFGGWEMPVRYSGDKEEHHAVRNSVGLFDVSHMGRLRFVGQDHLSFVDYLTINAATRLEDYQAQYSAMCKADGGIIDDVLVYREPESTLMVINAGNRDKDLRWILQHQNRFQSQVEDLSDETVLLALQGPKSVETLSKLTDLDLNTIQRYRFAQGKVADTEMKISRTGYTGEDGFELWFDANHAERIWNVLLDEGRELGIKPCGLEARNTLRLEAGYCLYGHEINETTNPLEAGLGWIIKLDKGDFVGREAINEIKNQRSQGNGNSLVGLTAEGSGRVAREGFKIIRGGKEIGFITSGAPSPTLGSRIALGYVPMELAHESEIAEVEVPPNGIVEMKIKKSPRFYEKKAA